jgi:serine/threonine-protein kinase
LGREVAVKVIHRHLRDEREVKERFYREAKAVAKLRHPNIVEVYDVSEPEDLERYLVVELVRGKTLRQILRDHTPLPTEIGIGIGIAVAQALAHAHEQGVVHRDVKPENVLLELPDRLRMPSNSEIPSNPTSQSGHGVARAVGVKITDFGIAKVLDVQGVTSTGEVLGSPAHMAPEQIEGQSVGPKADLFSLGVLVYECVVGHLPFQGNNPAQVLRRVLDGQFVPTARARPEVGTLVGRIIDRALEHEPDARFESAAEFAAALEAELARVDCNEPLQMLAEYLQEPREFEREHQEHLVAALLLRAQEARRQDAIVTAAALYNRALSLRPGDATILADVARLTRAQRRKAHFLRATVAGAILVSMGVGIWLVKARVSRTFGNARVQASALAPMASAIQFAPAKRLVSLRERARVALEAAAFKREPSTNGRNSAPVVSGTRLLTRQGAGPELVGTRVVQVVLSGAAGSRLLIDGVERSWFGIKHEIEFGLHRFEVIAPNEACCVVPEPKVVRIAPGEGEVRLVLAVEFRPAQLQLVGGAGATLTCGELFPGTLAAPGRRSVRVSRPETRAACTLIPPLDSGKRPRTIDVVLRPGGTFTVSGT